MNKSEIANYKTVYIETLGCSKNQVDSDRVAAFLTSQGFSLVSEQKAEVILINTCGFIQAAVEESLERILDLADLKKKTARKLVVMGCLSQRYQGDLTKELPEVDLFLGTGYLDELAELIQKSEHRLYADKWNAPEEGMIFPMHFSKSHAYIKIAEGCDNYCTYCIIPKLRGSFRSRTIASIVEEAERNARQGIKELILIAQDTSRYGVDLGRPMLLELLHHLQSVKGIRWIRLQYLYPDILDEAFFRELKTMNKVIPYFDIPIQHAANTVLKRMRRTTSKQQIIQVMNLARKHYKDATLRTTLIVGFPGETEEEFAELVQFIQEHPFDRLGVFQYSDEEEAASSRLPNKVDTETASRRMQHLLEIQETISEQRLTRYIGQTLPVILDVGGREPIGRTMHDAPEVDGIVYIHTDKNLRKGTIIELKITDSTPHDLIGEAQ